MTEIVEGIAWLDTITDRPAIIIANTVKGKGVSFMENNPAFHGAPPNDEQLQLAMTELGVSV
jgi:transketolase